jgi:hypothetical protein
MSKYLLLILLAALLAVVGCASPSSGSREYVPGKGWIKND